MSTQNNLKFSRFVLPSMLAMLLSGLYTIVDGFFIGQAVGDVGLAAIGLAWPIPALLIALGVGIGSGGSVRYSLHRGAGQDELAHRARGNTILLLLLAGGAATLVLPLAAPPLLRVLGAQGAIHEAALSYIRIIALGGSMQIIASGLVPLIRNSHRTVEAMCIMGGGLVCNILLDALFTMVLPWGLAGAAAATILSQTATAAAAALCLRRQKNDPVGRRELRPHGPTMLRILPVAAAPFGLSLMPSLITVFTNWQCLRYGGDPAVSAYSVANYFIACALLLLQGIGEGLQPLFSLHQGAGDHRALARLRHQGLLLAMGCSLLFWLISLPAAGLLPRFFGASAATARVMGRAMPLLCMAFPLLGLVKYFTAYYYACGESRRATLLVYGDPVLFTPACLLVLPPLLGLDGVWLSLPGAQILSALLLLLVSTWHKIKIPAKGGIRCGTESAPTDLTIL